MIEEQNNKADRRRHEEQIYREIVETVNSIILRWDRDLRVTFINRYALEFFGYTCDEILGKSLIGTIVPATSTAASDLAAMIRGIARHPEQYISNEIENVRHGGARVWVSWTNRAIMDKQGNVREIISVGNDITDRKRAEEALRQQLWMTGTLLDAIAIPVFYKNAAGIYTGCNRAFAAFLGKPKDEIIGKTVYEVAPPDLADIYHRADDELMHHPGKQIYETSVVAADGTRHDVLFNKATYLNEDGTVGGIIGTIFDITKRKNVERELVKAREGLERRVLERTKELEEANRSLRREIAEHKRAEEEFKEAKARAELYLDLMGHDIINMNQAMMGYLEMAKELVDLKGHEELIERPLEIIRHSSRLIDSVKKLELAQSGKYPLKVIDPGRMIKEVVDEYAKVPGRDVRINFFPIEGCYVQANDLLKDVFGNLVDNAIRHSEGPLDVDIRVEPVLEVGRRFYRVSVADNGPGISDDLKKRIFRIVDVATGIPGRRGLGLFMVRTLVRSYNGRVWVEDRIPGDYRKGCRFVVLLPAADRAAP